MTEYNADKAQENVAREEAAHEEALHNKIDGVVYMVPDSCAISLEGSYFTKKALEDAGIPVLMFKADPVNPGSWSRETMSAMVEDFIVHRVMKKDQ